MHAICLVDLILPDLLPNDIRRTVQIMNFVRMDLLTFSCYILYWKNYIEIGPS
jgi:hypothetical protein